MDNDPFFVVAVVVSFNPAQDEIQTENAADNVSKHADKSQSHFSSVTKDQQCSCNKLQDRIKGFVFSTAAQPAQTK